MKKAIASVAFILAGIGLSAQLGTGDLSGLKHSNNVKSESPTKMGFTSDLPSSYSLKAFTPYPKSQGHYGTCVSWATAYCAMTTQYAIANYITNRNIITAMAFCPFFTHNNTTPKLNTACDGNKFGTVGDELMNMGTKRFYLPQIICETPNNDYMVNGAKNYKISAYKYNYFASDGLTFSDTDHEANLREFFNKKKLFKIEDVKTLLTLNLIPDVSIWTPPSFCNASGPLWERSEAEKTDPTKAMMDQMKEDGASTPYQGHRIAIVGYDDNKYGGAFEIMNSWGSTFGEDGYIWVRYNDLQQFVTEIGWIEVKVAPMTGTGCVYGDCNNGYGIAKGAGGDMYEGFYKAGKFDGYGIYVWADGSSYAGEWKNGLRTGDAVCYYTDGTYGGVVYAADTIQSGFRSVTYTNGNSYQGYFNKGKFEGYGIFKFASGLVYKGQFSNGNNTGLGQFKFTDGSMYVGYVTNGNYNGLGMEVSASGQVKAGTWTNGKLTSGMKFGFASSSSTILGGVEGANMNYVDANCTTGDCLSGKGIRKFEGGSYYEGEFEDGVEHGWGKMVYPGGTSLEGNWELGTLNGPGIRKQPDGITAIGCYKAGAYDGYWVIIDAASNVDVRLFSNGTFIKTLSGQSYTDFASQKLELPMHTLAVKKVTNILLK